MNLVEISEKLKKFLELEGSPVGVKLIKLGSEVPKIDELDKALSYCAAVARARKGESLLLGRNKHGCLLGAYNLGLISPDLAKLGRAYTVMGIFSSIDAANKTINEIPKIDRETIEATAIFPLEKAPVEPDVIILMVKPKQALGMALALNYSGGGRFLSSFAGLGGMCGDATVIPYLKNISNFTIGDLGGRVHIAPEEMIVSLPASLLEEVMGSLQKVRLLIR